MQNLIVSIRIPALFQMFTICGSLSDILGSIIASVPYRGKAGKRYSPLNHFIAELGETGVSRLAMAFNLGLVLSRVFLLF